MNSETQVVSQVHICMIAEGLPRHRKRTL